MLGSDVFVLSKMPEVGSGHANSFAELILEQADGL
jgi:hypothetical protein